MKDKYVRKASSVRVVDGDTIEATIDLGYHTQVITQTFRLHGIDAYETRRGAWYKKLPKEEGERLLELGKKAKSLVQDLVNTADEVWIQSIKGSSKGKYGRWLAILFAYHHEKCINVNSLLVKKGFAIKKDY